MKGFKLIPFLIYIVLMLVTFTFYLIQGYLVQLELLKFLYALSALGLVTHIVTIKSVLQDKPLSKKWDVTIWGMDLLLLSVLLFISPGASQLFLFFIMVFVFYTGLVLGPPWSLVAASWFVFVIGVTLSVKSDIQTFAMILNIFLNAVSVYLMHILSAVVFNLFSEQKAENAYLEKINEGVFESVKVGLLVTNPEGEGVNSNLFFKSLSQILGLPNSLETVYDIFPEVRGADFLQGEVIDVIRNQKNQSAIYLRVRCHTIRLEGYQDDLLLFVVEDQTEIEKLSQSKKQSEKLAAVGTLAAGIAHEIRNPLAGMSGALQLMEPALNGHEEKKLAKIVFREIERLNGLITEFLDFARPEKAPTDVINLKTVIVESLSQVKQDVRFGFLQGPNSVTLNIDDFIPIYGHLERLKQVFLNLFINAAQAMESNDLSIEKQLRVRSELNKDKTVSIFVQDTGIGMDEVTLKKIFEPFHTTKVKGTGLGMAVSLKIIENHKGIIFVSSQVGLGALFELRFNLAQIAR